MLTATADMQHQPAGCNINRLAATSTGWLQHQPVVASEHSPTPRSSALPHKLTVSQPVQKLQHTTQSEGSLPCS